ncbi:PH domain-containing protein [Aequorivita marina]|uniref:PH domain-containing protein n=1 Tax=Aequorivita marina TaxID=3073654 RepID=UPI002876CF98|nr:PH domain-containing protein [Aequorivita sp. S2608]MDS1297309.1 PH domain-containing protein [Aequorivita sp. S2608]
MRVTFVYLCCLAFNQNQQEEHIMTKIYSSKVSYGLLSFIFLMFYEPLIPDFINSELNGKSIGFIILLTLVFMFLAHLFLKTKYTIDSNKLKIQCGLITYRPIDIDEIKEISKTNSIISSAAPSFERILIKNGKFKQVIIYPKNKVQFAKDLTS